MTRLDSAAWPRIEPNSVLVLPIGSTEQHGPHLPFTTDADLATALACELEAAREVTLAPTLPYGSSGEHQDFPGTLSIGNNVLHELLIELVRSATCSFSSVYIVNGHGGNVAALATAMKQLRAEGRFVHAFAPNLAADLHAGAFETSLMLHLQPERVRQPDAEAGNIATLAELWPSMAMHGVRSVSANGVLGDPRFASADQGRDLFNELVAQLLADFDAWRQGVGSSHG